MSMAYSDEFPKGSLAPIGSFGSPSGTPNYFNKLMESLAKNVRDRYYKGQTLYLDGYTFTNCCFHNCTLVTESGVFSLEACTLAGCKMVFGDNAIRIVKFYNLIDKEAESHSIFVPSVTSDGSVTIK